MSNQRQKCKDMLRFEIHKAILGVGKESGIGLGDAIETLHEVEDDLIGMLEKKLAIEGDSWNISDSRPILAVYRAFDWVCGHRWLLAGRVA